uniref:Uncharacterized protein n=1 Tax=Timema monikensis TaxID=170555 RepID=A0A7R9HR94_9NEOP|nr:unnamed protein product [Timema monikensis]
MSSHYPITGMRYRCCSHPSPVTYSCSDLSCANLAPGMSHRFWRHQGCGTLGRGTDREFLSRGVLYEKLKVPGRKIPKKPLVFGIMDPTPHPMVPPPLPEVLLKCGAILLDDIYLDKNGMSQFLMRNWPSRSEFMNSIQLWCEVEAAWEELADSQRAPGFETRGWLVASEFLPFRTQSRKPLRLRSLWMHASASKLCASVRKRARRNRILINPSKPMVARPSWSH